MNKKIMFLAPCFLLLAPCFSAEAQQQAKIPKIGYLGVRPDDSSAGVESSARVSRTRLCRRQELITSSIETRRTSPTGFRL